MVVYLINQLNTELYKIGVSKNVNNRLLQLQTGSAVKCQVVKFYETKNAYKIEKVLHQKYWSMKYDDHDFKTLVGEWFKLDVNIVLNFINDCEFINQNIEFLKKNDNPFI